MWLIGIVIEADMKIVGSSPAKFYFTVVSILYILQYQINNTDCVSFISLTGTVTCVAPVDMSLVQNPI